MKGNDRMNTTEQTDLVSTIDDYINESFNVWRNCMCFDYSGADEIKAVVSKLSPDQLRELGEHCKRYKTKGHSFDGPGWLGDFCLEHRLIVENDFPKYE